MSVCGTVPDSLTLEVISWHKTTPASPSRRSARFNGSPRYADLPTYLSSLPLRPGQPTPGQASPYASLLRNCQRYWNMNQFPIDYAFQPRLRGRLTLGRLTLPRKPWAFGGEESHLSFRYSCLHSLFCRLQHASQHTFFSSQNAPLPLILIKVSIRGFGTMLSPVTLSARNYSTSELLRTLLRNGCF